MLNIFPDDFTDFNDGSSYQYQEPGVSSYAEAPGVGLHSVHSGPGLHGPHGPGHGANVGTGLTRGPLVQDLVQQSRPFNRPVRWGIYDVIGSMCNVAVQCSLPVLFV